MNRDDSEQLREQLPWAVNGTLTPAEQAEVDAWLARDAEAAEEFAFLQRLAAEVKADTPDTIVSEFGWERLKRQLHTPAAAVATTSAALERPFNWWRGMGIAAMLVVAVQVGWVWQLQRDNAGLQYQLMSGAAPASAEQQWHFRLMLAPDATVQDLVALLQLTSGSIVAGPSALGLFDITVPVSADMTPQRILDQLSANPLVRHVEWTDAAAGD